MSRWAGIEEESEKGALNKPPSRYACISLGFQLPMAYLIGEPIPFNRLGPARPDGSIAYMDLINYFMRYSTLVCRPHRAPLTLLIPLFPAAATSGYLPPNTFPSTRLFV